MSKAALDPKTKRKSEQLNISVSPYIKEQLEELVKVGYFSNVLDAVRWAIAKMLAEFEAQGKLKPKKPPEKAEERIKNAIHVSQKEVDVD